MIHPSVPFPQQHLAELVEQGRRRGRDGALADRHAQHRLITAFLGFEPRRIRSHQFQQRNPMNARHLTRIGGQFPRRPTPDHHRRHDETGPGSEIIEGAENGIGAQREPHLLLEFTQRTLLGRLARVEATAGQCPLPGMAAQVRGATGEDEGRLRAPAVVHWQAFEIGTEALLHHGESHRSVQAFIDQVPAGIETPQTLVEQGPQIGITNHECKRFAIENSSRSIAGHRWSVAMPLETTARLGEHCTRLDDLLGRHQGLWRNSAFRDPQPVWLDEQPGLAATLLALDDHELQQLETDPDRLLDLLDPHVPGLRDTLLAVEPPWVRVELPAQVPFMDLHVPGRKWAQIRHFLAALPQAATPVVDWCGGKSHLGRSLARLQQRPVRCLERDAELCVSGGALAAGLPLSFECCDVLTDVPRLAAEDTLLALHACGKLHEHMLDRAVAAGVTRIHLAPCCYHLTPAWEARARSVRDPGFAQDDLHLAVQDLATAPARVRRARLRERAFRAGFDALQRALRGRDEYLTQPSLKGQQRLLDFPAFCVLMAERHGLELPPVAELSAWLEIGRLRDARSRRLELLRQGFRRAVELRIVLDRALFLAESGYAVNLLRFCPRTLTPRNLLIQAWN